MKSFAQFYLVEWLDRKNSRHFSNQIKVIDQSISWYNLTLENKFDRGKNPTTDQEACD